MDNRCREAPLLERRTRTSGWNSRRSIGLLLVLALLASPTGRSPSPAAASPQVQAQPARAQSVWFIENVGQFRPAEGMAGRSSPAEGMAGRSSPAEEGAEAAAPRFLVYGARHTMWLAEDGLWLTLSSGGEDDQSVESAPPQAAQTTAVPRTTANVHLTFPGSNPQPRLEPFDRLETRVSYFLGSDPAGWHPDVPVWGGVRYRDLYEGMDLWVTADGLRLVVGDTAAAEALSQVRLRVEGAENVAIEGGGLRLTTAAGEVVFPLLQIVGRTDSPAYPMIVGRAVSPTYIVDIPSPFAPPSTARALAAPAVQTQPTADPTDLLYSTYLGGSTGELGTDDEVHDVALDSTGNAYVTGYTRCSNFPSTSGAFSTTLASQSEDAFVAKLNASGSGLVYATFLGGTWPDKGYAIAVDGQGNAYVTGMTESPNWTPTSGGFPVTPGAFDEDYSNGSEGFVTKLNPSGTALLYSSYLGSYSGDDNGWDIAVDASGAAYVAGDTYGGYPFDAYPGWDRTYEGRLDGFAVKVNPSGSALVFSTYLGGGERDSGRGIAVGASGAVYVTGDTSSPDFFTNTSIATNSLDSANAFLVKLNADGLSPVYSSLFGGSSYDGGTAVAVDSSGAVYLAGQTYSNNLPVTPGCFDSTANGSSDIFVAKISGTSLSYCTYFGGSSYEAEPRIALNAASEAFVAGTTSSPDLPVGEGAFDTTHGGGTCGTPPNAGLCPDAFLFRLDSTGSTVEYSTFFGGVGSERLYGLAVDASSRAYLAGRTDSAGLPSSAGAFDASLGGTQDGFVSKIEPLGQPLGPTRTPTRTPTRSPTPTATATQTATPTPTATPRIPDLVADDLEVTQAVQNLNNSVRLVANKRTFVRFHVHSTLGQHSTYAQLRLEKDGGGTQTLVSESRFVRERPDRGLYDHSFLFELPDGFKDGTVKMRAEVNPVTAWRGRSPQELRYDNNLSPEVRVTFENVPQLNVVIYRVSYEAGGNAYTAPLNHASMLADWLRYGYPVSSVRTWLRTFSYGSGLPDCSSVNSILSRKRLWDRLTAWSVPAGTRYYAMVDDGGGFMQGCAPAVTAYVSSGPTGAPNAGFAAWDTDGCYGDWYGAHELGHDYGRGHANFCRATGGPAYPYPNGDISPSAVGKTALYGLNGGTLDIYPPSWKDLMSYCDFEWMSDFTYEGLMSFLQTSALSAAQAEAGPLLDRLLLVGTINQDTNQVDLQPLTIIPAVADIEPRQPGPYAIVLRGPGGELARYAFTPTTVAWGRPAAGATGDSPRLLAFEELLPYVAGTTRVDVVGPGGGTLVTVNAGAAAPTVSVTQPLAGQTLSGETVTVAWTAQDVDGDPLLFDVQYSPDNGTTWELLAQELDGSPLVLATANVVRSSGAQGRFRVWASDGIHSAYADSGAFTVPNHPPTVEILPPTGGVPLGGGIVIAAGQTLTLGGNPYDVDLGTLPGESVTWTSDVLGPLGEGPTISTADLLPGTHIITVRADDGAGGVATDTVTVTVVSNPLQLPPPPDGLRVTPKLVQLEPAANLGNPTVSIENANPGRSIRWEATVGAPWLNVSSSTGTTPADITLSYNGRYLPLGTYTTTVMFQSLDVPEERVEVNVHLTVGRHTLYLPVVLRRFNPAAPTPRPTASPTATPLPTLTWTPGPTRTATASPLPTDAGTRTPSATPSATQTGVASPTATATASPSATPSATLTGTSTATPTGTVPPTATRTPTATLSPTASPSATPSATPTATQTATATTPATATASPTPTRTLTPDAGWQTVFADGFEGAFPGPWRRYNEPVWGRTNCRAFAGVYSLWAGAEGSGAGTPCTGNYPHNLNTWLVYGPFDLSGATAAELTFRRWQRTELNYDFLFWMASVDGQQYYGWQSSGDSQGWREEIFDLSNVATIGDLRGRSKVWVAFLMQSDADTNYEGVFLDDVVIRKR